MSISNFCSASYDATAYKAIEITVCVMTPLKSTNFCRHGYNNGPWPVKNFKIYLSFVSVTLTFGGNWLANSNIFKPDRVNYHLLLSQYVNINSRKLLLLPLVLSHYFIKEQFVHYFTLRTISKNGKVCIPNVICITMNFALLGRCPTIRST